MKHYNQHNEVKLTGKLAEFRIALQEEIEASKRSSANAAIRIINGRRIAQIGGNYQYVFNIENALNTPGDTPGDLKVSGHQPLEIIIVSIEGMKITISVPIDLGEYVKEAKLQSNLTQLMRKLIERIEDLSYFNNAVSERIISGSATGDLKTIKLDGLNREQNQAVASSLGRNLTFILGPPGTGKTKTIGSICSELFNNGRTVLLVSHTNIAVDQALLKISENLNLSAHDLHEGEILRVGEPKDPRLRDHNPELLLSTHVDRRSAELAKKRDELISEINVRTKKVIEISHTIDICEWVEIASKDIQKMSLDIEKLHEIEITLEENEVKQRELSKHDLSWTQSRKKATGIINDKVNLKNVEIQMKINEDILTNNNNESRLLMAQLKESEELYNNTVSVGWLTRTWRKLPTPEKQLDIVNDIKDKLCNCDNVLTQLNSDLYNLKNKRSGYLRSINSFLSEYKKKPEDIVNQANNHFTNYNTIKDQCRNLSKKAFRLRKECKEILGERLLILNEIGLASNHKSTVEEMLQAIRDAYQSAVSETTNYDLHTLRAVRNKLNQRIITIQSELNIIEKQLKSVVDYFISRAKIIATTLTRAYLRDSIQSRKFDTVILDEASMAPIPALWVAASISENNAVVVGDNKQLPPIVISKHKTAIKWLGRDIFDVNKISKRVILRRQYRMHPKISLIPNELVYDKILEDDNSVINREMNWYNYHWGFNTPVLLVDTSSLGAWVTSVCRGTSVSRLNFLSATICVDIAEKLFLNEIKSNSQEEHKVLIVCPYRPHAQLLSLLIRENKLDNVVLAGTAHSFQGSEADVVILDLVIGEPHWRAGIFNPEWDDQYIRLLNVALTRARHRLIIVGDFSFIQAKAKKAFIGAKFIPFLLENYPCANPLDILPYGFATRASKTHKIIYGGETEPHSDRIVVTQDSFYGMFVKDLNDAKHRIVIYSAFISESRLGMLETPLRAARERGISIYVITKPITERKKREQDNYEKFESSFDIWGITVVHKRGMHEKLIFIDNDILWSGSLNPLSYSNTREIMERRKNKTVIEDFAGTLRLDDLIGGYNEGTPICPICNSEVVASEGKNEPFYWRCIQKDCYTRSIDQPLLKDGIIKCFNCGSDVEFGEWGGKPAWRCINNKRHRQRINRSHLRLPKMREKIPKGKLKELDKYYGL